MDTVTSENSIPFSSLNSPPRTESETMAEQEYDDSDVDGIFVERNSLTRNTNRVGEESLHLQRQNGSRRYILRFVIASALLASIVYVIVDFMGDRNIEKQLNKFLEWTHENPFRGILAVILCYIVATICFVPGSILTFGAGFAIGQAFDSMYLGVLLAIISVFVGASIGSICSFLLGRYLFRDCVLRLAFSYPIFQAIERALETNGLKIMVLLRLSPLIPFNALDYISGITSISLRDYSIALIAILPGAVVLCVAGASAQSLSDRTASTGNSTVEIILMVSGLLLGGYGVYLASYHSKMELDRILAAQSGHDEAGGNVGGGWSDEQDVEGYDVDNLGGNGTDDDDDLEGFSTELVEDTNFEIDR